MKVIHLISSLDKGGAETQLVELINHQLKQNIEIEVCYLKGNSYWVDYLKKKNIKYTYTNYNSGICEGMNLASKLISNDYILYAHDDFYFCPNWDQILKKEIDLIGHNNFYLSGTMVNNGQIDFNCGDTAKDFNEKKFLDHYKEHNFYDFQGSTWAPHLIHKDIWNKVGGFSEEFYPGTGSDPDLNMKLWNIGIRIFKGINNFKVYHFGSIVLRNKNIKLSKKKYGSISSKIFLIKWGITIKFFKKFYLRSNTKFNNPLSNPNKNLIYFISLAICKLNYFYLKVLYRKLNKII